jgi:hypothetical protein
MSDKSVFEKIDNSLGEVIQSIRIYHGEYFLGGLFLALHKPSLGWGLLSFSTFLPSIVLLKKPEWILQLREEKIEHVILFALLLLSSEIYALHCFALALGFHGL